MAIANEWEQRPETWAQTGMDVTGCDANGNPVEANRPQACAFCLKGALNRVIATGAASRNSTNELFGALVSELGDTVGAWNETPGRTVGEALALLRKVAAR